MSFAKLAVFASITWARMSVARLAVDVHHTGLIRHPSSGHTYNFAGISAEPNLRLV